MLWLRCVIGGDDGLAGVRSGWGQAGWVASWFGCNFGFDLSLQPQGPQPDGASNPARRCLMRHVWLGSSFPSTPQSAREVEITKPMSVIKIEQKTINQSEKKTGSRYTFQKLVRKTNFRGLLGSLLGVLPVLDSWADLDRL